MISGRIGHWFIHIGNIFEREASDFLVASMDTRFPQKLALGLSMGKGHLHQINLTTFIRPWSYHWGHALINTLYAVKMPNLYILKIYLH